jgi:hypothetical protein
MTRIALWTTYYKPKDDERNSEFIRCLSINAGNPHVDVFYILSEESVIPIKNTKLQVIKINERPSYNSFFDRYKTHEPNSVNVLINTDIVLDYRHTQRLSHVSNGNIFFALTRYEFLGPTKHIQSMNDILAVPTELFASDSIIESQFYFTQDMWVIFGYPTSGGVFTEQIGTPRCDGRTAFHFHRLGYKVYNPCLSVFTYHIHDNPDRSYYPPSCVGDVIYIRPTSIGAISEPNIAQIAMCKDGSTSGVVPQVADRKGQTLSFLRI